MNIVLCCFKWIFIIVLALVLLFFAYIGYIVLSFDKETLPQHYGNVEAKLFLGEGDSQPLIVGLGGAEGGNAWAGPHGERQRALLKEHGYAFLSIGYFGLAGIPEKLDRIAIDGIHQAVLAAASDPKINGNCIAVMGASRGGELALLLGSHYNDYKSVVGLVPGSAVFTALTDAMVTSGFAKDGEALPFVPVPWSATTNLLTGDLRGAFEKMMDNKEAMQAAAISVEDIAGPILLISGDQDEQWPSKEMSDNMIARLRDNNFSYSYEHLALQGGHGEHLNHFDRVINFFNAHLRTQSGCSRR